MFISRLKQDFFDLFYKGLRVQPEQACSIVVTCVVLHNLRIEQHDIIDTPPVQGQFQYEDTKGKLNGTTLLEPSLDTNARL